MAGRPVPAALSGTGHGTETGCGIGRKQTDPERDWDGTGLGRDRARMGGSEFVVHASDGARTDPRRAIPSAQRILEEPSLAEWVGATPARTARTVALVLDEVREGLARGESPPVPITPQALAAWVARRRSAESRPTLRPVVNATGVVLHTNLGRAPLAGEAIRSLVATARGYSNLEFDLATGQRGHRSDLVTDLLREVTGAESAHVLNNNAAAVFLTLRTLAAGRDVLVSRGELVEIGGSFRIPDVMAESGARLREVGTTNRTRAADYEASFGPETALVFKAHPSNFRIRGFTEEVPLGELARLAHSHGVPAVMDLGSGLLAEDLALDEPRVGDCLRAGIDLVLLSGDKLLGGPQAGIVLGRADLVRAIRIAPLSRALRVDKLTLSALEATLRLYRDGRLGEIPTLSMVGRPKERLRRDASRLARRLRAVVGATTRVRVETATSQVGGGSAPDVPLPTSVVTIEPGPLSAQDLIDRLRSGDPPVVARIVEDRVVLDPRTLLPGDEATLIRRAGEILQGTGEGTS